MSATMNRTRFEPFTNDELRLLWDGLTMDDGIRYGIDRCDPEPGLWKPAGLWELAAMLYEEALRRGLPAADPHVWEHVL